MPRARVALRSRADPPILQACSECNVQFTVSNAYPNDLCASCYTQQSDLAARRTIDRKWARIMRDKTSCDAEIVTTLVRCRVKGCCPDEVKELEELKFDKVTRKKAMTNVLILTTTSSQQSLIQGM
ncbi:hypothetical protein FRC02_004827 [Tulasnella sp. 418]|nr:hypothetical protein FRC02_004827 [Tulasnella sp. 418]